jgi:hypothetical protein
MKMQELFGYNIENVQVVSEIKSDPLADTFGADEDGADYSFTVSILPPLPNGDDEDNWDRLDSVVEDLGFKIDTYSNDCIVLESYDPLTPKSVRAVLRALRQGFKKHKFSIVDDAS